MFKKLTGLIIAAVLAFGVLVSPTYAAGQDWPSNGCGITTVKVVLWENAVGDTSDGNDFLQLCINTLVSISSLHAINHNPAGTCKGFLGGKTNWGDCISSVKLYNSWTLCGYYDTSYRNLSVEIHGPTGQVNLPGGTADSMSSLKIQAAGTSCPL